MKRKSTAGHSSLWRRRELGGGRREADRVALVFGAACRLAWEPEQTHREVGNGRAQLSWTPPGTEARHRAVFFLI